MANRLAASLSPYLRQHADNPVDWWEWGPAAFGEARERDVPILLSVGYAACHWCHVMAHESFEDADVAAALNAGFVAVKVDREERPDVDAAYMTATTAMTGHGGWPMTCLLTPSGEPFFAGTYLPKAAFLRLLHQAGQAWATRREAVLASGANVRAQLQGLARPTHVVPLSAAVLDGAASQLTRSYDVARGGFGGAPKFPPSMLLRFLARHHARTGAEAAAAMLAGTCRAMARGGMYDQLGGGFARYAVDADWVVPHFEKMLYDNALLLTAYTDWWRQSGDPLALRVANETADFLLRDLLTAEGGFAAALDADTEGVEGLTYAWTPQQLRDVLGVDDGDRAAALLGVTEAGTFEHGSSTLQLRADPEDPAWWATIRVTLLAARGERPQPSRDAKVVTSWNGLAIAALAQLGAIVDRHDLITAAARCARYLLDTHVAEGRLRRVSLDGRVGDAPGMADDYGNLAEGLAVLYQVTGDATWLAAAADLGDLAITLFKVDGRWREVPVDGEKLFLEPPAGADNAEPSGISALAAAFLSLGALSDESRFREAAEDLLAQNSALAQQSPRFAGWTLATAEAALAGPVQVTVVGDDAVAAEMRRLVVSAHTPGLVLAPGPGVAVDGRGTAYVCRDFVCELPVTSVEELAAALAR